MSLPAFTALMAARITALVPQSESLTLGVTHVAQGFGNADD
jgi:hypothetical protein